MARLRKTALTHHIRPITKVKGCEYVFYFIAIAVDIGTVTECGVCGWTWQWFALVKGDRTSFVTTNWYIPVKNTFDRNAVMFCSCEIIQIFYVVFCVVWTVHKFYFRLLINGSKNCCAVTEIYFLTVCLFFPDRRHNGLCAFRSHCTAKQMVHVGAEFSLCVSVTGVRTAFRGRAAPVLVYKERESTFLRPVKRSSCLKFLWLLRHIFFCSSCVSMLYVRTK